MLITLENFEQMICQNLKNLFNDERYTLITLGKFDPEDVQPKNLKMKILMFERHQLMTLRKFELDNVKFQKNWK